MAFNVVVKLIAISDIWKMELDFFMFFCSLYIEGVLANDRYNVIVCVFWIHFVSVI